MILYYWDELEELDDMLVEGIDAEEGIALYSEPDEASIAGYAEYTEIVVFKVKLEPEQLVGLKRDVGNVWYDVLMTLESKPQNKVYEFVGEIEPIQLDIHSYTGQCELIVEKP